MSLLLPPHGWLLMMGEGNDVRSLGEVGIVLERKCKLSVTTMAALWNEGELSSE